MNDVIQSDLVRSVLIHCASILLDGRFLKDDNENVDRDGDPDLRFDSILGRAEECCDAQVLLSKRSIVSARACRHGRGFIRNPTQRPIIEPHRHVEEAGSFNPRHVT
jgi:hypothetical protein